MNFEEWAEKSGCNYRSETCSEYKEGAEAGWIAREEEVDRLEDENRKLRNAIASSMGRRV